MILQHIRATGIMGSLKQGPLACKFATVGICNDPPLWECRSGEKHFTVTSFSCSEQVLHMCMTCTYHTKASHELLTCYTCVQFYANITH